MNNNNNKPTKVCSNIKEVIRHPKYLDFYKATFVITNYQGRQFSEEEFIMLFNQYLELF